MARTPLLERRLQLGAAAVLTVAEEATPEDVRAMVSNLRAMRECSAEGPPSTVSEAGALERWERRA